MRLFVIGRVFDGDKLVAYKLYDANSNKTGIYTKEAVHFRVKQGILIVGLIVSTTGAVTGLHGSFNISKTDILNGKGQPIKESGRYTLVAVSGFAENTEYRIVNSKGYEKIVNTSELKELVDKDLINGVKKSDRMKDNLIIYKYCKVREYWIENNSTIEIL